MASAFQKKWIAFRGSITRVPIDKLPSISYCKFLFSSVYKLCQSLTVLAEITHARCLPQADFFWIASSKNVSAISKNKIMEKYFVLSMLKIFQLLCWKALAFSCLQFGTQSFFSSGRYICKHKKCPYYIKLSLKNHCLHMLGKDLFCSYIFFSPTLGMLHSLSLLKGNWAAYALLHGVTEYTPGQGYKGWAGYSLKFRASHLVLLADLAGDKSVLITATPLAGVTVASLNLNDTLRFNIYLYIHTSTQF